MKALPYQGQLKFKPMTFLTTRLRLKKALAPEEFRKLSHLWTVYGIRGLSVEAQHLTVEYDASRIHEAEILAEVHRAGLAVEPEHPLPLGGFDHTGEFRDFAWPVRGLSPVNEKAP